MAEGDVDGVGELDDPTLRAAVVGLDGAGTAGDASVVSVTVAGETPAPGAVEAGLASRTVEPVVVATGSGNGTRPEPERGAGAAGALTVIAVGATPPDAGRRASTNVPLPPPRTATIAAPRKAPATATMGAITRPDRRGTQPCSCSTKDASIATERTAHPLYALGPPSARRPSRQGAQHTKCSP